MNEALRDWVATCETTFYCIAGRRPSSLSGDGARFPVRHRRGGPPADDADGGTAARHAGRLHRRRIERHGPLPSVPRRGGADRRRRGRRQGHRDGRARRLADRRPARRAARQSHLCRTARARSRKRIPSRPVSTTPASGPSVAWRAEGAGPCRVCCPATDSEALEAFQLLCRLEGVIPALEPAHALAHVSKLAPTLPKDNLLVINLCGRGDKDVFAVAERLGMKI